MAMGVLRKSGARRPRAPIRRAAGSRSPALTARGVVLRDKYPALAADIEARLARPFRRGHGHGAAAGP